MIHTVFETLGSNFLHSTAPAPAKVTVEMFIARLRWEINHSSITVYSEIASKSGKNHCLQFKVFYSLYQRVSIKSQTHGQYVSAFHCSVIKHFTGTPKRLLHVRLGIGDPAPFFHISFRYFASPYCSLFSLRFFMCVHQLHHHRHQWQ